MTDRPTMTQDQFLWTIVLCGSFIPFLMKSLTYMGIQSFFPGILFIVLFSGVYIGLRHSFQTGVVALQTWALLLIAWGCRQRHPDDPDLLR